MIISSIAAEVAVGQWVECNQPDCTMMFYRYTKGHKCYTISDELGTCPLCIRCRQEQNGTLPKKKGNVSDYVHHKSNDAKPGADTL